MAQSQELGRIRVDKVRISNFRSLRNIEVDLGQTTLLVGMNNSGKTSFLRALHLALGADRRLVSPDDFFVSAIGEVANEILIDIRIVPIGSNDQRAKTFVQAWVDTDFGGSVVAFESGDNEFVAIRTRITHDTVRNDFVLDRRRLAAWHPFDTWHDASDTGRAPRFDQVVSFFIDAQRDVAGDLRTRTSHLGRLLSKIEIPEETVAELEARLQSLNADLVAHSEVLSHIRGVLAALNRTVPAFGDGVEITPVSKKLRDLTKGLGIQFADSNGSSFPIEAHGMGTRSWASLLSFQAYVSWTAKLSEGQGLPFHPILSLEEPEAHLHPNAQRSVHHQLTAGVGQRIVSTHSPYIAGQAELADIVHFAKHNAETQVSRVSCGELTADDARKVRREVMRTRGELLFARAVVLFEGETEEQSLPMFARFRWKQHPFERGVAFVGVGGDGNYFPFLRTFASLGIKWFVFSDGEPNAKARVGIALKKISLTLPHPNVIVLPDGNAIEGYLMAQGYQAQLKSAVLEYEKPRLHNSHHEQARSSEIGQWNDEELMEFLKSNKTGMASHWAKAIIAMSGSRAVPCAIGKLLDAIDCLLNDSPTEQAP